MRSSHPKSQLYPTSSDARGPRGDVGVKRYEIRQPRVGPEKLSFVDFFVKLLLARRRRTKEGLHSLNYAFLLIDIRIK